MKNLSKATYTLSIKIYIDRSRRLIIFSMSTYLDNFFEIVQNGTAKEGVLACVARCEVE